MRKVRCSKHYHKVKIGTLSNPAIAVRDGMFGHPDLFPSPPITQPIYQGLIDDFLDTWSAYKYGGSAQQGAYRQANMDLKQGMDTMATYVDSVAQGDASVIRTAGFKPTKESASMGPLPEQLKAIKLTRGVTGQILARCERQDNASTYICIMTEGAPLPEDHKLNVSGQMMLDINSLLSISLLNGGIDFSKGRKKKFSGLTPGKTYFFVFFVINSRGVGSMSDPVSIICY